MLTHHILGTDWLVPEAVQLNANAIKIVTFGEKSSSKTNIMGQSNEKDWMVTYSEITPLCKILLL